MKGVGFQCDKCRMMAVLSDHEVVLNNVEVPAGWFHVGSTRNAGHFCSGACVVAYVQDMR